MSCGGCHVSFLADHDINDTKYDGEVIKNMVAVLVLRSYSLASRESPLDPSRPVTRNQKMQSAEQVGVTYMYVEKGYLQ